MFISSILTTSCTEDYSLDDRGLAVEELPNYVAFEAPGASSSIAPIDAAEDSEAEEIGVEIPGGTVSDVTVNYSFSGTAVFGEDFTVDGATSAGGTVVIELTTVPNQDGLPPNANIVVNFLTDGVEDGDKTLEITLTDASNAEGNIAVGRAGTEALTTAVVNIADIDAVEEDAG